MNKSKKNGNFSDRLTPGQVQQILDALRLPWRAYKNPENNGWVNLPNDSFENRWFNGGLSINVHHGGWIDQYMSEEPGQYFNCIPIRGDIVSLVAWMRFEDTKPARAITWIKETINNGVQPPDLGEGYKFANDHYTARDSNFVRLPVEVMQSKLSGNAKIVWCVIFSRCWNDKIYSFAGTRSISQEAGLTKRTVLKAIKDLLNAGLLIEKHRGRNLPPARFPLVANASIINDKIKSTISAGAESAPPLVQNKQTAGVISNPKLDEGEVYEGEVYKNANKSGTEKTAVPDDENFNFFLIRAYAERQEEAYKSFLAKYNLDKLPDPPSGYQKAFEATFKTENHEREENRKNHLPAG